MRYPYERFLRFLVSRKIEINSTLERYGLPIVGDMWIAVCRQDLREHAPHGLATYIDSAATELTFTEGVLAWADSEGTGDLWRMQREFGGTPAPPQCDLAFRLFVNQYTRAVLGCLLLSTASDKEIQAVLFDHFGVTLSDEALAIYRCIFWDVSLLGRKSWDEFYKKLTSHEERSYIAFGINSPSADEVRDMLGLETVHSDEQIVNLIASKSFLQFKRAMEEPHPEAAGAMRWAELSLRAISVKKSAGLTIPKTGDGAGPTTTDFHNLFSVKPEKSAHITLAQLAGEVALPVRKDKEKGA